ncbi:MAG: DUF4468 domain-containing protein [Cytophagaceae bacterium]|nr:DUF4468 domain-containing protein [Cytophagaceae bacterium]MDW8456767.1 DUF4468 domain-containing protein [Cytophagaceae bacterium]
MKHIGLIFLFYAFIQYYSDAQNLPVDSITKKITWTETVPMPKLKKNDIYLKAYNWGTSNKYTVKKLDKPNGIFACLAKIDVTYPGATSGLTDKGYVQFLVTITCKDGKYIYTITDLEHFGDKGKGNGGKLEAQTAACGKLILPNHGWTKIKQETEKKMPAFIDSLKSGMAK